MGVTLVYLSTSDARADAGANDAAVDAAPDAAPVDSGAGAEAGPPKPPPTAEAEADAGDANAPTRFIDTGNDGACSIGTSGQSAGALATLAVAVCAVILTTRRRR